MDPLDASGLVSVIVGITRPDSPAGQVDILGGRPPLLAGHHKRHQVRSRPGPLRQIHLALRVQTQPAHAEELVVIRLLPRDNRLITIRELGPQERLARTPSPPLRTVESGSTSQPDGAPTLGRSRRCDLRTDIQSPRRNHLPARLRSPRAPHRCHLRNS